MNILQEYYQDKTASANHLYDAKKIKEISRAYPNHVFYTCSQERRLNILYKGKCYKYNIVGESVDHLNWVFENMPIQRLRPSTLYHISTIREYFK